MKRFKRMLALENITKLRWPKINLNMDQIVGQSR